VNTSNVIRLAIGVPAYGGRVVAEHLRMFLELGHSLALSTSRFQLASGGYLDVCGIDKARNDLVESAVKASADWLLMIDADTWVVPDGEDDAGFQLLRMISEADRAGAWVVGAPVIRRYGGGHSREIMAYRWSKLNTSFPPQVPHDAVLQPLDDDDVQDKLQDVDALATAVLAINLHKTKDFKFRFTERLSEDLNFCKDVLGNGGPILLDGRVRTAHLSRPYAILSKEPPDVVDASNFRG